MPIERLPLNFPFFPLLWALTPLIGSTIGIYIYCIAVSLSARDLADWGIILY